MPTLILFLVTIAVIAIALLAARPHPVKVRGTWPLAGTLEQARNTLAAHFDEVLAATHPAPDHWVVTDAKGRELSLRLTLAAAGPSLLVLGETGDQVWRTVERIVTPIQRAPFSLDP